MDIKKIRFYFSSGYIESEIVKKGFSFSEIYHNKLQAADGSMKFSIPFNIEIANFLKAEINQRIKAEIFTSTNTVFYTGYIKQDVSFEKGQRNEPITLTVVSPSFYLDKELPRNIAVVNKSVDFIVKSILTEIGFEEGIKATGMNELLPFFTAEKGKSAKSILQELCYEFGYVYYFDNLGRFSVRELFDDIPPSLKVADLEKSIKQTFDGSSLRDKLKIQAKEHDADCVRATYENVASYQNTLVFSDTQGAEENDKCRIKINSGWSMFATEEDGAGFEKINYLDFDSTAGKVLYVDGITPDVVFDDGITYNITDIDTDGSRLCAKAIVTAMNSTTSELYCRKLDIYAKQAYIATSTNEVVSSQGTKAKSVTLSYIYNKRLAEKFVENLANYYRYCNFTITAKSTKDYALGSFVKVEEYGTGTFFGRIIQKQYSLEKDAIDYKIETISDFEVATVETSGKKQHAINAASALRGEKGEAGRSGQDGATPFVYLEYSSYTFSVDNDGKVEPKKIRIPVHCLCDNVELPFTFGAIEQKDGIHITTYETKDEYNHVIERGIDVETEKDFILDASSTIIPIILTEVAHSYAYGDEEERIVIGVLEEGLAYGELALESSDSTIDYKLPFSWAVSRQDVYRGAKKSIDGFLSPDTQTNLHRGDWFTWAGENHTKATYNGVTVDFLTGGVYKWNGDYWEKDESVEHMSSALTDVLSVNDDMLKANNEKMDMLLGKLATQQAFLDDLNNSVLPSMLANNERLNEELAVAKTFWQTLAQNKDYEKLLAQQQTFATELVDAKNNFQSHMAQAQTFQNELAKQTDFENTLATQENFEKKLAAQEVFATTLAAQEVFAKKVVANETFTNTLTSSTAFINSLVAKQIKADSMTSNTAFVSELMANEAIMKKLSTNEAFIQKLAANEAFIQTLVVDDAFVNNLVADYVQANSGVFRDTFTSKLAANDAFVKNIVASKAFIDKLIATQIDTETLTTQSAFIRALTSNDAFIKRLATHEGFLTNLMSNHLVLKKENTKLTYYDKDENGKIIDKHELDRDGVIQSSNYQAGVQGWQIKHDGEAEFNNNVTVTGTIHAKEGDLENCTINASCTVKGEIDMSNVTGAIGAFHVSYNKKIKGATIWSVTEGDHFNDKEFDYTWENLDKTVSHAGSHYGEKIRVHKWISECERAYGNSSGWHHYDKLEIFVDDECIHSESDGWRTGDDADAVWFPEIVIKLKDINIGTAIVVDLPVLEAKGRFDSFPASNTDEAYTGLKGLMYLDSKDHRLRILQS